LPCGRAFEEHVELADRVAISCRVRLRKGRLDLLDPRQGLRGRIMVAVPEAVRSGTRRGGERQQRVGDAAPAPNLRDPQRQRRGVEILVA
jgi:hypothetical protein